jgi:teichuronic acid biosynthesis glycosyltransferase TuaG
MINPLVSIITPSHNSAKYIAETIEFIINQTYPYWELLITDDCSTDSTVAIIESYIKKDSRIKLFKLDVNSGAAIARNNSIQNAHAQGKYIAFCDSDDVWYSEKLERQINSMEEKNAALCFTAIEMIDENGVLLKGKRTVKEQVDYKYLLKNTTIATSSLIVDREKAGDFRMPLLRSGQDYATWLQLTRNGTKALGINEALVRYRVRKGSLSSSKLKNIKKVYNIQTKYENINAFKAIINCAFYALNALKKYFI